MREETSLHVTATRLRRPRRHLIRCLEARSRQGGLGHGGPPCL